MKFTSDKLTEEENIVKCLLEIMIKLGENYKEEIWVLYGSSEQIKLIHDFIPSFLEFHKISQPENFERLIEESQRLKQICDHFSA